MKRLRFRIILLAFWLVLFFNTERMIGAIAISNVTYILVLAMALVILLSSRLPKISFWVILMVSLACLLLLKGVVGDLAISAVAAHVVIEILAVVVTAILAYWLNRAINEFEVAVSHISIGRYEKLPEPDSTGQGFIYREVRRARNHQRPLALMAIGVNEKTLQLTVDRMVKEMQLAMTKQYKLSGLSRMLCDELEDCAIIVQREDQFLIALPETKPEEVPVIIDRIRKRAADRVGVELEIGTATLPKDGFTFEGLLDKATVEMKEGSKAHPLVDIDRIPSEHPATVSK